MDASALKKGVERAFISKGFARCGKSLRRKGQKVETLIAFEKGFGSQWHINVGFWLNALGDVVPELVHKTHLYFRLERLFPAFREMILIAGAIDDVGQAEAYEELIHVIEGELDCSLNKLGTEDGLSSAMRDNQLSNKGLVTQEAREYLASV